MAEQKYGFLPPYQNFALGDVDSRLGLIHDWIARETKGIESGRVPVPPS
jgi:hypothetical protein